MMVELHGAGQHNKGAELMLQTVVDQISRHIPNAQFVIDPCYGSHSWRTAFGLWQMFPLRTHVGTSGFQKRLVAQRAFAAFRGEWFMHRLQLGRLKDYGCVSLRRVDALIDISGFAFSDQWGDRPAHDMAALVRCYRRAGKPVILLPQAFGPFTSPRIRRDIATIIGLCDLLYARDPASLEHLRDIAPNAANVKLAPDITLGFQVPARASDPKERYVCIVPNMRVVRSVAGFERTRYIDIMTSVVQKVSTCGFGVNLIVHDLTGEDLALAHEISAKCSRSDVPVVADLSGADLKIMLGRAAFIVASRFHSIVSALSNAVPVVVLGWSHKYGELLKDFGVEDFIVSPSEGEADVTRKLELLICDSYRTCLRDRLAARLVQHRAALEHMWMDVTVCLRAIAERAA